MNNQEDDWHFEKKKNKRFQRSKEQQFITKPKSTEWIFYENAWKETLYSPVFSCKTPEEFDYLFKKSPHSNLNSIFYDPKEDAYKGVAFNTELPG